MSGPTAAVKHAGAIAAAYANLWGCEAVCEGLPTTILRPPKRSPLAAHIDSASLLELYVGCKYMLCARAPTAQAWAARHGQHNHAEKEMNASTRSYELPHDAAAAYMGELCRVFSARVSRWARWERRILSAIYEALKLPLIVTADIQGWVSHADDLT